MLTLKAGAACGLIAGMFVTALVVGCSASGTTDDSLPTTDIKNTDPADGGSTISKKIPAPTNSSASSSSSGGADQGDDGTTDLSSSSSSSSSGSVDGGHDSGPTAPQIGDTCSAADQKFPRACGHCGTQEAICASNRNGDLKVSDYGPCGAQHGVCSAGDLQPCGNKCGTQACGSTCLWGTCTNEGVCVKGLITHDTAGCPTAGTYRAKVCEDTCSFGALSACEAPDLTVPANVGDVSSTQWELTSAMLGKRPEGGCKKSSTLASVTSFPIPLHNPTNTDAVVSIWHTSAGTKLDTALYTYATLPSNDSDFKACTTEVADGCNVTGLCDSSSLFAGVDNVTVPANSTIIVYSAGWTTSVVGKFTLNIKTKSH